MYEHKANKWKIEIIITKKYISSSKKNQKNKINKTRFIKHRIFI